MTFDPIRFEPAARRFKNFFDELNATFAERENVLAQISLALLARQHVLLAGPPGTAKSQLASAVFGRIVDEETGRPSLYSRQIGESTVRTDLVGPLDFKTLMETGRSEHFTDEGMLGAVHAFLDEVFDGRDMLLRDALNVLQERELKQGTRIVKGRIECALMTSNRYLVEVLESSRETLLAFVDRIAFAGFVPRGFATETALESVLCRHVGRGGPSTLLAPLTVQDIDALQNACDEVTISDAMCGRLALLLRRFDAEILEATRADPAFIPTRYVSTRTAVTAGRLLRAIVILRRVFEQPGRALSVTADDFRLLYLHLVLCGPTVKNVEALLARERDPRERRQLGLVQTEGLIFERVLASLPAAPVEAMPSMPPTVILFQENAAPGPRITQPLTSANPATVLEGLKVVMQAIESGDVTPADGQALLETGIGTLNAHALTLTLVPPSASSASVDQLVEHFSSLADDIESGVPNARHVARWLRGRAIAMLEDGARFSPSRGSSVTGLRARVDAESVVDTARKRLAGLVEREERRKTLRARGADVSAATSDAWAATVAHTEAELVIVWDEAVCARLAERFKNGLGDVSRVIDALTPLLAELLEVERVLGSLGAGERFRSRVLEPRLTRVLDSTFAQLLLTERSAVLVTIATLQRTLDAAGLRDFVAPSSWVRWAADALLSSEPGVLPTVASTYDYEAYSNLRRGEQRISNAYALADVALRSATMLGQGTAGPTHAHAQVVDALSALTNERRERAVALDVARMDRALTLLEGWWNRLAAADPNALASERFLEVAWDEGAILRFALETRALAQLFPVEAAPAHAILARAEVLHAAVRTRISAQLRERADTAWLTSFPETGTP